MYYSESLIIRTPLNMGVWICVQKIEIVQITKINALLLWHVQLIIFMFNHYIHNKVNYIHNIP